MTKVGTFQVVKTLFLGEKGKGFGESPVCSEKAPSHLFLCPVSSPAPPSPQGLIRSRQLFSLSLSPGGYRCCTTSA